MAHSLDLLSLNRGKAAQFEAKGLTTIEDIAYFFPRKYYDFRKITSACDVDPQRGEYYAMQGVVKEIRDGSRVRSVMVEEQRCTTNGYRPRFYVNWFGYGGGDLVVGKTYTFCGRVTAYLDRVQITEPLAYSSDSTTVCRIMPIYSKIRGMSQAFLDRQIAASLKILSADLPPKEKEDLAQRLHLPDRIAAAGEIHTPTSAETFRMASRRIAFERIYDFYEELYRRQTPKDTPTMPPMTKDALTKRVIAQLPFPLTADQDATIRAIMEQCRNGQRLNTLVSGDVGCGKTMIALLSAVFFFENGYQTIFMAPTQILAQQHERELKSYLEPLGIRVGLLTGQTKAKERRTLTERLSDGSVNILIGTHAVLGGDITPQNLGLIIIDEEHKFGVKQKEGLGCIAEQGVSRLSMTATPIPRSIAMTLYGNESAVMPIRTMPQGRKPIITRQVRRMDDAFAEVYKEVKEGRQGYIVCPFIDDSNAERCKDVVSVQAAHKAAESYFSKCDTPVRLGVITGDMKQKDITDIVQRFLDREFDVLLSTTIIEVGVNVLNASIIAVLSAERFGLSALHQLRGRVGRGSEQGYCILCSVDMSERLDILCSTTDGFEIAERDMVLRGPGDLTGEAQSGDSKVIDLILRRPKFAKLIRDEIFNR